MDALDKTNFKHVHYTEDLGIHVRIPKDRLDEGIGLFEQSARAVSDWAACSSIKGVIVLQ